MGGRSVRPALGVSSATRPDPWSSSPGRTGMTAIETRPETANTRRIEHLNRVSLRRIIEPDEEVTGTLSKKQVIPEDLLSIDGLDIDLTPEQRATLAREEMASIVRF